MYILGIANQKGGTGKTSTTVYLGYALARRAGCRVLLVDMDPQASLTGCFTTRATERSEEEGEGTVYTGLMSQLPIRPYHSSPTLSLLAATIDLAAAEVRLPSKRNNERALARLLDLYRQDYAYCLVDCPPSLGILTVNALTAAHSLLVPTSTESMSERTMPLILDLIREIQESGLNPGLSVWRILPTLFDRRLSHHKEILEVLRTKHGSLVYDEPVAATTKYKDASGMRVDIVELDPRLGDYWDRMASVLLAETRR